MFHTYMVDHGHFCKLSLHVFRLLYNAGRCFVQFVMPLSVVVGVYISIFWRLLHRPVSQHSENHRRRRRTNIMIISVSVTFFLSWLPLNAINFMLDLKKEEIAVRKARINLA